MLRNRLADALKGAMKAHDKRAVSTLRLILAALKDRDIAARSKGDSEPIGEDEIMLMLRKMISQRRDSIEMYAKGGRDDLVEQEAAEIAIIEGFLPKQMDDDAIVAAVEVAIAETGAEGVKDMGRLMSLLRERFPGEMDFGKASAKIKERLS